MDEKLTKRLVLKFNNVQNRPTKGAVLAGLNDGIGVNLIRLIDTKNAFIAICHSEEDAIKMNGPQGLDTLQKLGLTIANTLAFEARKAIIVRGFDTWITSHTTEQIQTEFNNKYPETPCTKVVTLGERKALLKIIFTKQEDAKTISNSGFSIFHVRVPDYNISVDEFIEVPMCMKCYQINNHYSGKCNSTKIICSECSIEGHRHNDCRATFKKCINCGGPHKTTAPQCPKRKQEAQNIRQKLNHKQVKEGVTYSSMVKSTTTGLPDSSFMSTSVLKITSAMIYAHTVNAVIPGSFNTEINKILSANNLPTMVFPDNPPSELILTKMQQKPNEEQMETQSSEPAAQTTETIIPKPITEIQKNHASTGCSPDPKRKRMDPRIELSTDKLGLRFYVDPTAQFTKPKKTVYSLPTNKYKFVYTNTNYQKLEIIELLRNNRIQIKPSSIHVSASTEEYNKLSNGHKQGQHGQTTEN